MPYDGLGNYSPVAGAETATAGATIASATWNSINTDYQTALTAAAKGTAARKNRIWVDRNNVDQTGITNNTPTKVAFNHENLDPDNVFDAVTNFRYTPNVPGTFLVSGTVGLTAGSNLLAASSSIFKNGSEVFRNQINVINATGLSFISVPFSGLVSMNGTTDFLEIFANINDNGGGTVTFNGSNVISYLNAMWIGP